MIPDMIADVLQLTCHIMTDGVRCCVQRVMYGTHHNMSHSIICCAIKRPSGTARTPAPGPHHKNLPFALSGPSPPKHDGHCLSK